MRGVVDLPDPLRSRRSLRPTLTREDSRKQRMYGADVHAGQASIDEAHGMRAGESGMRPLGPPSRARWSTTSLLRSPVSRTANPRARGATIWVLTRCLWPTAHPLVRGDVTCLSVQASSPTAHHHMTWSIRPVAYKILRDRGSTSLAIVARSTLHEWRPDDGRTTLAYEDLTGSHSGSRDSSRGPPSRARA